MEGERDREKKERDIASALWEEGISIEMMSV